MSPTATPSPAERVVAASMTAYNARDLDSFMTLFADSVEVRDLRTDLVLRGAADVRRVYAALFDASPTLHSRVAHRAVLGTFVVDHEIVTGRAGGDVDIVITYEVVDERIRRVWFVREPLAAPVHIRAATPADVDTVVAVGRETYADHFAHIWSEAGLHGYLDREFGRDAVARDLATTSVTYLLAEAEAESGALVVGFAKLRHDRPVPGLAGASGVELQKIYLRKTTVSRGVGTQLLAACVRDAERHGAPLLWLDVLERNDGAARFYLRNGFERVGQEPFPIDGKAETLLVMVKRLS